MRIEKNPEVYGPQHYNGDECMRAIERAGHGHSMCFGNAMKYVWRLGSKVPKQPGPLLRLFLRLVGFEPKTREELILQDAQKVEWYVDRYIHTGGAPLRTEDVQEMDLAYAQIPEDIVNSDDPKVKLAGNILDVCQRKLSEL